MDLKWCRAISALMPPGMAWDAMHNDNSVMYRLVCSLAEPFRVVYEMAVSAVINFIQQQASSALNWSASDYQALLLQYGIPSEVLENQFPPLTCDNFTAESPCYSPPWAFVILIRVESLDAVGLETYDIEPLTCDNFHAESPCYGEAWEWYLIVINPDSALDNNARDAVEQHAQTHTIIQWEEGAIL